jgi:hypothetical protein
LWLGGPLVLLLGGAGILLAARKRRPVEATPAPLSDEERARVNALLAPIVTPSEAEGPVHAAGGKRGDPSTALRSARDDG